MVDTSTSKQLTSRVNRHTRLAPEISGYDLLRPIGAGGAGTVYEARCTETGETVAIKCLKENLTNDARRRWYQEVKNSKKINHDHCVRTLKSGFSEQGHPYMVMELVGAGTLSDLIPFLSTSKNRSRYEMIVSLCSQILDGLAHAHSLGIIHRDLKPSNILLQCDGDWYLPKIADFGISIVAGEKRETATGQLVGTPAYWSPEQADGLSEIDIRSDLYSFGVLLYEMLSGRRPFDGCGIDDLFSAHRNKAVPPLPEHTPPQLTQIVNKLLAKNADDRQGTAQDVRNELLRWQEVVHAMNIPSLALDPAAALDAASIMFSVLKVGSLSAAYKKYLLAIAEIATEFDVDGSDFLLGELNAHAEIGDIAAAKTWYSRAHENGDPRASFKLALLEDDEQRKEILLEVASEGGNAQACTMLAELARSRGDFTAQISWLTKAHELGSAEGTLELGHAFMRIGMLTKAKGLFRQAYRDGDFQALVRAEFCELVLRLVEIREDAWAMSRARAMLELEGLDLDAVLEAEGIEAVEEFEVVEEFEAVEEFELLELEPPAALMPAEGEPDDSAPPCAGTFPTLGDPKHVTANEEPESNEETTLFRARDSDHQDILTVAAMVSDDEGDGAKPPSKGFDGEGATGEGSVELGMAGRYGDEERGRSPLTVATVALGLALVGAGLIFFGFDFGFGSGSDSHGDPREQILVLSDMSARQDEAAESKPEQSERDDAESLAASQGDAARPAEATGDPKQADATTVTLKGSTEGFEPDDPMDSITSMLEGRDERVPRSTERGQDRPAGSRAAGPAPKPELLPPEPEPVVAEPDPSEDFDLL